MQTEEQTGLDDEFEQLSSIWESIEQTPEPPRSLMDIIEYGLGKQRRAEVYINRLLCYLLNPTSPHGMGDDFLLSLFNAIPINESLVGDVLDSTNVRVREQVPIWLVAPDDLEEGDEGESPGYIDLLIDVPGDWFLLIELKFSAEETGTEKYCKSKQVGDNKVDEYESGGHYLYLHQSDRPSAEGDCFIDWTWDDFIENFLSPFIANGLSRYPQRTAVQIHDLRYDIKQISNMADQQTDQDRKIALYLDHAKPIDDVRGAFNNAWEQYENEWDERVAAYLAGNENVSETIQTTDNENTQLILNRTDANGQPERWLLRIAGGHWHHITKWGWFRQIGTGEILTDRDENHDDLRIGFYFRMATDPFKKRAVHDREVAFNFRCMGSNPTSFKDLFRTKFINERGKIESLISETPGELTGNKETIIEAIYPIDTSADDFFTAYTTAIKSGIEDFILDNPDLIKSLSQIYEDSRREWESNNMI